MSVHQKAMMKCFLDTMASEDQYWMHKMLLWPKVEITDVYIITLNRLWGRAKFGWFEKDAAFKYSPAEAERAAMCTCGAWVITKRGNVYHVADCCCGAE